MDKKKYFNLEGDVAVVTGGSSGLGVQFAKALANQGANIALVARREEKLKEVKKEIENFGVKVEYYTCDVTDSKAVKEMVEKVEADFGKIDILVNNAGLGKTAPTAEMEDDLWNQMMDININSVFYVAREVGKVMLKHKYGRIINLGSVHSSIVMKNGALNAYATTKGAVRMMTKALAAEWAKEGITVNTIGPAYFESEMTEGLINTDYFQQVVKTYCPMERVGKEGELDSTLLFFAARESSYVTGQIMTVDGGWTAI